MALCEGFFVNRRTIVDLISHHQDNLGRAVLALSFWAASGGGDVGASAAASPLASANVDDSDVWSNVKQLLLGSASASSVPTIEPPPPMIGVSEFFGVVATDFTTSTSIPIDFLQCPPGIYLQQLEASSWCREGISHLSQKPSQYKLGVPL